MGTSSVCKHFSTLAILLAGAVLTSCGGEGNSEGDAVASEPVVKSVAIENSTYKPATTTIELGDKIKFTNRDEIPHYAISRVPLTFETMPMMENESYVVEPSKRGTFTYFCSLKPKMKGRVVVN
ncbi:MAG TPA: cupredoxin domain-containing protein [Solirubrobacterales bacterium]|nr:cupredoxin domain-containing protein [Solirubrobacterales bacterium]